PLFPHAGAPSMPWWGLALCAAVGVIAGLQSALLSVMLYGVEDLCRKLPVHWMWWPALGGIAVGLGGWYDPAVLGVGYDNIAALINGQMTLHAAVSLLIGKATVWIAALASGTSGGVLAPLLMMGGALGAIEAHVLPFGDAGFWALVAMSAVFGGTMRAPLTATIFAVELTGNLQVMPAVLAACAASFATTVLIMRRSILTERLARRGRHLSYEYSVDPFEVMRVSEIMAKPVDALPASTPIAEAVAFFDTPSDTRRHKSYPVVDEDNRATGMVSRSDVLRWTRDGWNSGETLRDHGNTTGFFVGYADELVGKLADRMVAADIGRAPIIERQTGQLVGLVARRDLLRVRAQAARQEHERGRMLRMFGQQT
ncbi:MAG: chloride channel protein, partial [Pseudomonadota bacterium]|nr:chloride channel protein [Pseudomonadota bacterium]